jgi:ABC-2 type transport system ATP-binding protein
VIKVEGLRKQFGDTVAVDGVSFTAETGAIFGLLGPNGAGKSTTIGCISGLLAPDAGHTSVMGHDLQRDGKAAKAMLGVVPQELALYEEISARENLSYWGGAYGLRGARLKERVAEVLDLVELSDRAKEPVKNFSGGMKRRLNFGCGLVHEPRVLLLDEPTVGVDPQSRVRLLELVRSQADAGLCVLYTTHYMDEAEKLCDRLAIVDHGRLIAEGKLEELRAMMEERDILRLSGSFDARAVNAALSALEGVGEVSADEESITLDLVKAGSRLPELFAAVAATGGEIRETTLTQPSLESLFIKLTGRELRE